ncbi:hypothetical protein SAMN05880580_103238 [Priestia flexa]|nr:hypothetical protein [Priestia flexa]SIQ18729.1 hypothetical protein SAMN05880580_103238 [Priestia flexa]
MNHSVDVKQLKAMKQTLTRFMMAYKFALNGYQSLHLIIEILVFMSDRQENVFIELQIRSIAMDFWPALNIKFTINIIKRFQSS